MNAVTSVSHVPSLMVSLVVSLLSGEPVNDSDECLMRMKCDNLAAKALMFELKIRIHIFDFDLIMLLH